MQPSSKELSYAHALMDMALAFGYTGRVLPDGSRKLTGKWYNKKRKEILAWVRSNLPEVHSAYLGARKISKSSDDGRDQEST